MATEREQKLVDICFQIGLMMSSPGKDRSDQPYDFSKWTIEEKTEWIAKTLRECGFPTKPCGSLWGVLL